MPIVTTGKPKVGGAVYVAPTSATLPTDATTALTGFTSLGYISDSGLVNSNSMSSTTIKAWGGDAVAYVSGDKEDTFQFTLLEATNLEVLKLIYGSTNVTGTLSTGITVNANATEPEYHAFSIEMLFGEGVVKRIVIPKGKVTSVGDITYKDDEAVGYQVTVSAVKDSSENTHYEYIKQ